MSTESETAISLNLELVRWHERRTILRGSKNIRVILRYQQASFAEMDIPDEVYRFFWASVADGVFVSVSQSGVSGSCDSFSGYVLTKSVNPLCIAFIEE